MSPEVKAAYEAMVRGIRAHLSHVELVGLAEAYINAIEAHAKRTGRKMPIPKVNFLLRFHDR